MASPKDDLAQFSHYLHNAAPEEFNRMVNTLEQYAYEFTVAVTNAPSTDILTAQGRAQMALGLLRIFKEAPAYKPKTPKPPSP